MNTCNSLYRNELYSPRQTGFPREAGADKQGVPRISRFPPPRGAAFPGGDRAAAPVLLPVDITLDPAGWSDLLSAIAGAPKYVELDLSGCDITGMTATLGEFDPGYTIRTGKDQIVSLVLPETATSIKAGDYAASTFNYFSKLESVTGANIEIVGEWVFRGLPLTSVDLPEAELIGDYAFSNCTALETVSLNAAESIGSSAFYGCTALATLSLPAIPPRLETNMFGGITVSQTVTVKVPAGALSAYGPPPANTTDNNWGNAFRGKGWDGTSYLTGTVNGNITLLIEELAF